jgi:hypothetical protein
MQPVVETVQPDNQVGGFVSINTFVRIYTDSEDRIRMDTTPYTRSVGKKYTANQTEKKKSDDSQQLSILL